MRHIRRESLPITARLALFGQQQLANSGAGGPNQWKNFRASNAAVPVTEALRRMAGERERCYFCSDSRGVDVEHFSPKNPDVARMFVWSNFLWACTACNRAKQNFATLDPAGKPVIIDPTRVQPWEHFYFDRATGIITPKYMPDETEDPLAVLTLERIHPVNHEAVATGRTQVANRLVERASDALADPAKGPLLVREILEEDYGLGLWYSRFEGRLEEPFCDLRTANASLWRRVLRTAAN